MQNKKIIILIVLGVAAFFSLIYGIVTPSKIRRQVTSTSDVVQKDEIAEPVEVDISTLIQRHPRETTYTNWGRDPFSVYSGSTTVSGFTLNGILWDEEKPMAIINGDIVGIGDHVGISTVVDIKKDKVILNDGSRDFELQ